MRITTALKGGSIIGVASGNMALAFTGGALNGTMNSFINRDIESKLQTRKAAGERASRMEEGIEVIRGMWTQDPFSYQGKHYHLKNISMMPKAPQTPHPPLWVGAGTRKASRMDPVEAIRK